MIDIVVSEFLSMETLMHCTCLGVCAIDFQTTPFVRRIYAKRANSLEGIRLFMAVTLENIRWGYEQQPQWQCV